MDWIKALKPGDKVYLHSRWGAGWRNATVEKVGRRWMTLSSGNRFNMESGRLGDSSHELWPSQEAYEADRTRRKRWRHVEAFINKVANGADPEFTNGIDSNNEALEQIEQLLGLTPKNPDFQLTYKEAMTSPNIIRVAGIDPSMRNTGVALAEFNLDTCEFNVDKIDVVQTERLAGKVVRQNSDDYRSAREMIKGVDKLLLAYGVTFCFAELPTGAQSARAAFAFGMATAIMAGLTPPLIQVQPREVQIAVLGKAGKNKEAIIEWAVAKWPNAGWMTRKFKGEIKLLADNEHPADACAAIAAGVQTAEFAQAMALSAGFRRAA